MLQPRLGADLHRAGDGVLRYRIPIGWMQGPADDAAPGSLLWLVRDDLAATLSVRPVSIDSVTRQEVDRNGLQRFAELHATLTTEEMRGSITVRPVLSKAGSAPASVYECRLNESQDWVRVYLVDTGARVYQVNILAPARTVVGGKEELAAVQDGFVNALVW